MSDGSDPPVLIGERVWWLGSGSGLPKPGAVRWIGRLPEIGPDWSLGIELEESLPYGGVDGTWRGRQLFKCKPKHGLIVPSDRVLAHQSGGASLDSNLRKDVSLLPLQKQISAPPRLRRSQERAVSQDRPFSQERSSLLLDRHSDFRSVHLEAVQIRRRIQQDQVVSLVLGQTSGSPGDVFLSRGMTRTEGVVVPRTRRTESLAARKEKTSSGLFSFLRWFRRENKTDRGNERSSFSNPGSPVLKRSDSAITGSVDTLFSTATAASFAYVQPESYKPFGDASEPQKWIYPGPETHTYRNRIRRRDEFRRLNQNLSLREKYNLYASGSLGRSLDEIFDDGSLERLQPTESCSSTLARKKRKAPEPPPREDSLTGCDSLPTTLSKESLDDFKLHRRTVSESAKYKNKKGCHIKGKRKAPPPPTSPSESQERDSVEIETSNPNTLRKKRKAPPPPIDCSQGNVVNIPKEKALDVIDNDKLKHQAHNNINEPSTSRNHQETESVSSTDTLRLEKGMLKPNKLDKNYVEPKHAPTSPVSPRPWYKRPQSSGSSPKQSDWKKKESKSIDDWMFESGFPRRSQAFTSESKFSIFNKVDKPEDKRRSQISILTNISELDREAAEIIQRGKEREQSLLASYNAKYYVESDNTDDPSQSKKDEGIQTDKVPKKPTAKELITLFNSITNVSKVTVNNYIATEEMFTRQTPENGNGELVNPLNEIINGYQQNGCAGNAVDSQIPGPSGISLIGRGVSRNRLNSTDDSKICKVTIEELDEYDDEKSKSQKTNGINPIPTITEVSDTDMKSSSGSTICSSLLNDSSSSLSGESASGAKIKSSQLFSNYPVKLSLWKCSRCTLENPRWRLTCEACDMWRPTVCDYKLCKKPSAEQVAEQYKPYPVLNSSSNKENQSGNKSEPSSKPLDKETTNLIRNGQVLSNISQQKNGFDILKLKSSPGAVKRLIHKDIPVDKAIGNASPSKNTNQPSSSNDPEQAEVVRKARLAFFNKSEIKNDKLDITNNSNNLDNISKATSDKLKLRELLKEMKNSLPKQRKSTAASSSGQGNKPMIVKQNSLNETNSPEPIYAAVNKSKNLRQKSFDEAVKVESEKNVSCIVTSKASISSNTSIDKLDKIISENSKDKLISKNFNKPIIVDSVSKILGGGKNNHKSINVIHEENVKTKTDVRDQVRVIPIQLPSTSREDSSEQELRKAEAILVKSEITIEEIKVKKKPEKVSSSAQTSTKVVSLEDSSKSDEAFKSDVNSKLDESSSSNISKYLISTPINVSSNTTQPTNSSSISGSAFNPAESSKTSTETFISFGSSYAGTPSESSSSAKTAVSVPSSSKVENIKTEPSSTTIINRDKLKSPSSMPPSNEVIVPVTAEEYLLNNNGMLEESSVKTEPAKIDIKKFDLMRPRDFTKPTLVPIDLTSKDTNDLKNVAPTPTTPSSSSSSVNLNLVKESQPGPSTSKDEASSSLAIGTIALNRLLRRLETAITDGQHDVAAVLAKELAKLKVPCTVVRHPSIQSKNIDITMNIMVEDAQSQRGPITMRVKPWLTLNDLKRNIEQHHNIPYQNQKWFIDNKLASDDSASIKQLGVEGPSTPVFLYLIATGETKQMEEIKVQTESSKNKILNITRDEDKSLLHAPSAPLPSPTGWKCEPCGKINLDQDIFCSSCIRRPGTSSKMPCEIDKDLPGSKLAENKENEKPADIRIKQDIKDPPRQAKPSTSTQAVERERRENYQRLVDLEKDEVVISTVAFECPVCFVECQPPHGVVLKECLHSFCRGCLSKTVEYSEEAEVKCPYRDANYTCDSILLEREIKALVSKDLYEQHLAKSIAQAETNISNAFHCKTPDCKGWCIFEDNVNLFKCPVCLHHNCLTCQVIHEGLNCKEYQEQINQDSEISIEAKRTKEMLQEMVDRGEAMPCPRCKVVLMKKWGCDWLRCSMCKTEICWVTRGPRWGPNGKGDTSSGCKCGVNGIKCHPKCNYCH